jgi:16S rRNA processing protein RimM
VHELIGLRVVTNTGQELGTIGDVISTGANDVWVVPGSNGELMIPAIADVIERVDTAAGVVIITPLMGMLDNSK